ncbi:hypothetical protein SRHO_G00003390 [Serrasalmus rhombeus]
MAVVSMDRQYLVARPLYSDDSISGQYGKLYRHHKGLLHHFKEYFLICDSQRVKNAALSLLPVIGWMKIYRFREWLFNDIVSGISTGLVAVLQGLAFALLARLPPGYGLYTAFFPAMVYFFLGTSRHLSVGPFPVLSMMIGDVVLRLADNAPVNITGFEELTLEERRVVVASSVTFLMGIFQLSLGLLRVGFIVIYLSDTLVSGFTTAAAVHILVSQLKFVLGLNVDSKNGILSIFRSLEEIFRNISQTNLADLVISIVIMAVVFIVKELNDMFKSKLPVPIPIEIIMTVITCGVSYGFNFTTRYNVTVIGDMLKGYEAPFAPNVEVMQQSVVDGFITAIVGFAVAFSVAKVYAVKHDYTINGNQELIAFGVSNIFGASFRSFAASTALSRTAVQESTGGKTQSVLGALVIVNLKGMLMQFREICYLWRKDKVDLINEPKGVKILRIPAPIFFANIDFFRDKLVKAVGFNPLRILRKRNRALRKIQKMLKSGELQLSPTGLKPLVHPAADAREDEGDVEDLDKPVDFSDLPFWVNWNGELPSNIYVPPVPIHSLVLDFSAVSFIDISALNGLKTLLREFIRVDVEIYIASCDAYVFEKLHNCKFFDDEITTSMFYPTIHDAVLHTLEEHPSHSKAQEYEKEAQFKVSSIQTEGLNLRRTEKQVCTTRL